MFSIARWRDIHVPDLFFAHQDVPKPYLECLKRLNLIFAMDKPHCFEGRALDFFPNLDFCGFLKKFNASIYKSFCLVYKQIYLKNISKVLIIFSCVLRRLFRKKTAYYCPMWLIC
ncbi:hypothetical protein B0182_13830 [Moraxella bovis]|nr:hypothetical protein DQF64_11735 [Moraxella bovis]OOR86251.1 hypothetical protein B0182_13830 [Moraxella bovis]